MIATTTSHLSSSSFNFIDKPLLEHLNLPLSKLDEGLPTPTLQELDLLKAPTPINETIKITTTELNKP